MIKAILLEDTRDNRETLIAMLHKHCPEIHIVAESENVNQAYQLIHLFKPDLVFLDIQLDKETSFDLLAKLHAEGSINFEIIFVTGHGSAENATRAVDYSALDFINKPIDPEKLIKAVNKAKTKLNKIQYEKQIELLLQHFQVNNQKHPKIAIQLLKGVVEFVVVDEITQCCANGPITEVFFADGSKMTAMKNLGHYSRLLTKDYQFFQISNDTIINLDQVKRYNHSELQVEFNNGTTTYASRRGGQDFKRYLQDNIQFRDIHKESKSMLGYFKDVFKN